MDCHQAQSDIALWVGNDLEEPECLELSLHLDVCPNCARYQQDMQRTWSLLEESMSSDGHCQSGRPGQQESTSLSDSLWPALSVRLSTTTRPADNREFPGWIPALALTTVAATLMILVTGPAAGPPQGTDARDGWTTQTPTSGYSLLPLGGTDTGDMHATGVDGPQVWRDHNLRLDSFRRRETLPQGFDFSPRPLGRAFDDLQSVDPQRDVLLIRDTPGGFVVQ